MPYGISALVMLGGIRSAFLIYRAAEHASPGYAAGFSLILNIPNRIYESWNATAARQMCWPMSSGCGLSALGWASRSPASLHA